MSQMSKEWHAKYYQEHKSQFREYNKAERIRNKDKWRDRERKYAVKLKYKMTREEHIARLEKQDFRCAFPNCGTVVTLFSDVDHNHACCPGERSCGKCVRGILCHQHNNGLSFFEDRPKTLLDAFKYLGGSQ